MLFLNEAETRAKLIDPAIHGRGWTEDLIKREESAGAVEIVDGRPRKRSKGRVDYTLRVKVTPDSQPVAIALIEAKSENLPPEHGLEQVKLYAESKRLNVPFVFSTNGHLFVMYDKFSGQTSQPKPLAVFPTPAELRADYEKGMGFSLASAGAKPLLERYQGGEATRRYYQDAAIRAVLEKIAKGENRALLALATGSGKTFIAVNLLKKIADAGQLRRALFLCDRDELRSQGLGAFQNVFGTNAAEVMGSNPQKNARILIATYQTLDVDTDDADANFLTENYPENFFSHIIIDECHRSAWGKWSMVLKRNEAAVQVGLTATPRKLTGINWDEFPADVKITGDNLRYFGEPVYEYEMAQGMDDGYLAACDIVQRDIFLDRKELPEIETGLDKPDLVNKKISDALTGQYVTERELAQKYQAGSFEKTLVLPERVHAMCADLFNLLLKSGGPEQKTIIFCASDDHADKVAIKMNNLYAKFCAEMEVKPAQPYAFKCTSESSGNDYLPDLRGASRSHFIATTVDLLTTGVDVPVVENIVFFKYVRSPIAFYQMVGRGTRINAPTGKLMFRVYDYTNARRLFGKEFLTRFVQESEPGGSDKPKPIIVQAEGFEVIVTDAGNSILTMLDGKAMPVTVEEYKQKLTAELVQRAPTLDAFRTIWIDPNARRGLLDGLPDGGRSAMLVRKLDELEACDLYDVLANLGYGLAPKTRLERAAAFTYKHEAWLGTMPRQSAETLRAMAMQFGWSGTDGLENPLIFETPEVMRSGGLLALRSLGKPVDVLRETKTRIFAA
jgi:type I restriction enzyme R subunit